MKREDIEEAILAAMEKGLPDDTMMIVTGDRLNELLGIDEYEVGELYELYNGEIRKVYCL